MSGPLKFYDLAALTVQACPQIERKSGYTMPVSRFLRTAFAAIVILSSSSAWAQSRFFAALEDVPIPAGYSETAQGFAFEGQDGRLVEAHARGAGDAAAFFRETLPALGWNVAPSDADHLNFRRGAERLSVEVSENGAPRDLIVRLVTRPAPD